MKALQPWTRTSHLLPLTYYKNKKSSSPRSHYIKVSVTSNQTKSLSDSISFAYLSSRLSISCQIYEFFIYWRGLLLSTLQTLSQAVSLPIHFYTILPCKCSIFLYNQIFLVIYFPLVTVLVSEMCPQIQWYPLLKRGSFIPFPLSVGWTSWSISSA